MCRKRVSLVFFACWFRASRSGCSVSVSCWVYCRTKLFSMEEGPLSLCTSRWIRRVTEISSSHFAICIFKALFVNGPVFYLLPCRNRIVLVIRHREGNALSGWELVRQSNFHLLALVFLLHIASTLFFWSVRCGACDFAVNEPVIACIGRPHALATRVREWGFAFRTRL